MRRRDSSRFLARQRLRSSGRGDIFRKETNPSVHALNMRDRNCHRSETGGQILGTARRNEHGAALARSG